jgi:RHS repeat-associated protein
MRYHVAIKTGIEKMRIQGVCMQSTSDYSPFGVLLDGRSMQKMGYRYSFQGQEHDDEVKGEGNSLNFNYRMHDPRVGRWLSLDPEFEMFPDLSPYSGMANNPILVIDIEGAIIEISGLTGDKRDAFLAKINSGTVQFKINEANQLVLVDPAAKIDGVYATTLVTAINDAQTVKLDLVEDAAGDVLIDVFATGKVDVNEMNMLSSPLFQTNLIHIIEERFSVVDYELNKETADFDPAHDKALMKEEEFTKELYPDKKVKYNARKSGMDNASIKMADDGKSGTIDYIYDFGDVKQVTTFNLGMVEVTDPTTGAKSEELTVTGVKSMEYKIDE